VVTHVGILEGGRLIREDSIENIRQNLLRCLKIVASPMDMVKKVLNDMGIYGYRCPNEYYLELMEAMDRRDEILKNLIEQDVHIVECTPIYDSLENYFMSITGGNSYAERPSF